ncbi:MAG: ABC transporter permease [Gemmataceae bacterium]|nr:ABC transporter permease [Gemmataceae bacterium]
MDMLARVGEAARFAWLATLALPSARFSAMLVQLHHVLVGGLPLAATAGAAIGLVSWLHLREAVARTALPGAVLHLPAYYALAVVLVLAPLAAGLITAGRTGASLGAELGSMTLTEQVDALEVLGRPALKELVAPRLLACMLALPVLTVLVAYLALAAGWLAEMAGGTLTSTQYQAAILRELRLGQVVAHTLKTVAYGWLIGLAGCWQGLEARGGTEGVGKAATRAVVASIFLVLLADVVLVWVIQALAG